MRLDALRQRPWALAAILGSVLGLAAGAVTPPRAATDAAAEPEAAWSLPTPQDTVREDDRAYQAVRQASIWFAEGGATGAAAKWKLVGVVAEGDQRTALLLVAGQPDLLRVHNGDPLPEGGQVVDVGRYGMRINIYGCENLILRLYTPGQRSPAPDCGYASDDIAPRTGLAGRGPGGAHVGGRPGAHRAGGAPHRAGTSRPGRGGPRANRTNARPGGPRAGAGPRAGNRAGGAGARPGAGNAPTAPANANR